MFDMHKFRSSDDDDTFRLNSPTIQYLRHTKKESHFRVKHSIPSKQKIDIYGLPTSSCNVT